MTTETETKPTQCVCKQKCEHQLSWASRAPMAQCYSDDAECTCWCHEQGRTERENGKRRSIWYVKVHAAVRG
jgi:hypothetical protein